jgi:hypothetical protein
VLLKEEDLGTGDDKLPAAVEYLMLDGWILHALVGLLVDFPLAQSIPQRFHIVVRTIAADRHRHVLPAIDLKVGEVGQEANGDHPHLVHVCQEHAGAVPRPGSSIDETVIVLVDQQVQRFDVGEEEAFVGEGQ